MRKCTLVSIRISRRSAKCAWPPLSGGARRKGFAACSVEPSSIWVQTRPASWKNRTPARTISLRQAVADATQRGGKLSTLSQVSRSDFSTEATEPTAVPDIPIMSKKRSSTCVPRRSRLSSEKKSAGVASGGRDDRNVAPCFFSRSG